MPDPPETRNPDPVMIAIEAAGLSEIIYNNRNIDVNKILTRLESTKNYTLLTSYLSPFQPPSTSCMSDIDASLLESSDDDAMSQRPGTSKPAPKVNPQRTRAQAQAQGTGSGSATAPEAEKRKADDVLMDLSLIHI